MALGRGARGDSRRPRRRGAAVLAAAETLDGGAVDRIVGDYAGGFRSPACMRPPRALSAAGRAPLRLRRREQVSGMARTFRCRVPAGTPSTACRYAGADHDRRGGTPNYMSRHAVCDDRRRRTTRRLGKPLGSAVHARSRRWRYEPGDAGGHRRPRRQRRRPRPSRARRRCAPATTPSSWTRRRSAPALELLGDHAASTAIPTTASSATAWAAPASSARSGSAMPPGLAGAAQIIPMRALAAARLPGKAERGRARRDRPISTWRSSSPSTSAPRSST